MDQEYFGGGHDNQGANIRTRKMNQAKAKAGIPSSPITQSPLPPQDGSSDIDALINGLVGTPQPGSTPVGAAPQSFGDAFAAARAKMGPGQVFDWNGKQYTTDRADDTGSPVGTAPNNLDPSIPGSKMAGSPYQPPANVVGVDGDGMDSEVPTRDNDSGGSVWDWLLPALLGGGTGAAMAASRDPLAGGKGPKPRIEPSLSTPNGTSADKIAPDKTFPKDTGGISGKPTAKPTTLSDYLTQLMGGSPASAPSANGAIAETAPAAAVADDLPLPPDPEVNDPALLQMDDEGPGLRQPAPVAPDPEMEAIDAAKNASAAKINTPKAKKLTDQAAFNITNGAPPEVRAAMKAFSTNKMDARQLLQVLTKHQDIPGVAKILKSLLAGVKGL